MLVGPFTQILTMRNLPAKGIIKDEQLEIIENGAVILEDEKIHSILTNDAFLSAKKDYRNKSGDNSFFEILFMHHIELCFRT